MDDILYFRRMMAEQGFERTPAEAVEVHDAGETFIEQCENQLRANPNALEEVQGVRPEEILDMGIEMTLEEATDVLDIYCEGLKIAQQRMV